MISPFRERSQLKGIHLQHGILGPKTLIGQMMTIHRPKRPKKERTIDSKREAPVRARRKGITPHKSKGGDMENNHRRKNQWTW
jgi:hypothetical protein